MLRTLRRLVENAEKCYHRHLIVIPGAREYGLSKLREILDNFDFPRKIVFTWKKDFSIPCEIEELKNSDKYLGTTYDFLAVDFHHSFVPNDLGRLVNIVRGGGLIVFLTPDFDEWPKMHNFFHESILTPPYTLNDVRGNFARWIVKKLRESEGVSIYSQDRWIKVSDVKCKKYTRNVEIPQNTKFPTEIYEKCITQDQVSVLKASESIADGGVMVLTADRGRGKSSVLGLIVASLLGKVRRVYVTAPDINNINEFFRFLKIGLSALGIKYREKQRGIFGKKFSVVYQEPSNLNAKDCDLVIADEAAGIPVPLLLKYLRAKRVIYSTTVHGYEGTGRSFSIRFMGELKKRVKKIINVSMDEPIRYSSDDPVERWLFNALLLDSEPWENAPEKIELSKLRYKKYSIEDLLCDENKLREYYGIFVLAHYRNNPNDFGILCDAPNHEIRVLEYDGHIVCSVQLAKEGKIEDYADDLYFGEMPPGNIVPDVIIKHYKDRDFSRYSGYRIVRIATHPKLMDQGIGSVMLQHLSKENVDWIGSSFGATSQLLNFWEKNGFHAIHVSSKINEKTGEYSVVVIKPLSKDVEKKVEKIRRIFGERFSIYLSEIHADMDVNIAWHLLNSTPRKGKIKLDDLNWRRLVAYAWGPANYETTMDAVYKLAQQYFLAKKVPQLNREQEKILIAKVLQRKSWKRAGRDIGHGDMYVVIELREIVRKFIGGEYDDEVFEFQRRFHGENNKR